PGRNPRRAREAAHAALRLLPPRGEARRRTARSGGALSPRQRRGARAPELDGRRLGAGHAALRRHDGELRLLARRSREEPRALPPRAPYRRLARPWTDPTPRAH